MPKPNLSQQILSMIFPDEGSKCSCCGVAQEFCRNPLREGIEKLKAEAAVGTLTDFLFGGLTRPKPETPSESTTAPAKGILGWINE